MVRSLVGWARAAHPFPLAAVVVLTGLVGLVSTRGGPDLGRFTLMLLGMLLSQLVIGWTNDYVDRRKDAAFQPWKPVPAGRVPAALLPRAAGLALAGATVCGLSLGPLTLLFLIVGTAAGLAYNAGLKDGALSWLPYVLAFAVLPPYVWSALDAFRREYFWLYPIGAFLAVAAHISNALPDVEADRRTRRLGLVARLGRDAALRLLMLSLAAPAVLAFLSILWLDYSLLLAPTLAVYGLLCAIAGAVYARSASREAAVHGFRLVAVAAVSFSAGWLASVG